MYLMLIPCAHLRNRELVDLTVFVLGVKLWHMWLTPYRRVVVKGSAVYDLSKQFSSDWQAYVASNMHFYTTLLIMFMRY